MKERELFWLFVVYSVIPILVSIILLSAIVTKFFSLPLIESGVIGSLVQVGIVVIPWLLLIMNMHIYFIKKIDNQDKSKLFMGVTILQGLISLVSLIILLSITFF